ncbi:MAG: DnaJ domain-containing protein [Flavobacterium sp.]
MTDNYYEVLGVSEKATKDEIKRAYRTLQMKHHPDKNPGNHECMLMTQRINEAYETLSDEQKRQEYDMMRANPFMRMESHGPHTNVPFDDIFNMMFGANPFQGKAGPFQGNAGPFQGMPPGNIHIFHGGPMNMGQAFGKPVPIMKTISITMEQAYHGASIPIEIERWVLEEGTKVFEQEVIYVDVPPGIDNEMIILRDRGNVISEQCKGDIKLSVTIVNETAFKRAGVDLVLEKTITLKEALCGFQFELKHVNGKTYTLNNNRGSIVPPGYKKMYPGMGMIRGERKGHLVIQFVIEFPTVLTTAQMEQLSAIL